MGSGRGRGVKGDRCWDFSLGFVVGPLYPQLFSDGLITWPIGMFLELPCSGFDGSHMEVRVVEWGAGVTMPFGPPAWKHMELDC